MADAAKIECTNCALHFDLTSRRCPRCGYRYIVTSFGTQWASPTVPSFVAPSFVDEGMDVYVSWNGEWVACNVAVASGHSARVLNEPLGVDLWVHIDNLRIELKSAQAMNRLEEP